MSRPIYAATCFAVYATDNGFRVIDTYEDVGHQYTDRTFDTLQDALEYVDNGELTDEALALLQEYR